MKTKLLVAIGMLSLLTGCIGARPSYDHDHVDLIQYEPDKVVILITKMQWGGFYGIHGFIGFEHDAYQAELAGTGPTFTNPKFQDNPPTIDCVGTITLDREHNRVKVNMRRVVSKPGSVERTVRHPANGTYTIESTRQADPGEPAF